MQTDSISMESPVDLIITVYYMSHIENQVCFCFVFLNLKLYVRCIDDIFLLSNNFNKIRNLKKFYVPQLQTKY